MTARKNKFIYGRSFKVIHWGCRFDSLTELRFAISIQEDYEFIGARVTIYYDRKTGIPTNYVTGRCSSYTPDFLIRHRQTGEAFLVEIKPRAAEKDSQLILRKQVAENYIKWKGYDWKYRVVFSDEIILSETELAVFEDCCKLKSRSALNLWLLEQPQRYDKSAPSFFARIPRETDIRYIMFGIRTEKQGWNNTT
jgi:hypothetical protein